MSQRARREIRVRAGQGRQELGRGLGFRTADAAAGGMAAAVIHGQMTAQAPGLAMPAAHDPAFQDDRRPQPGAQRDHHKVVAAASRTIAPFANGRHARVVFQYARQVEFGRGPGSQIEVRHVAKPAELGANPARAWIDEAGDGDAQPGAIRNADALGGRQSPQGLRDGRQSRRHALLGFRCESFQGENLTLANQAKLDARGTDIAGKNGRHGRLRGYFHVRHCLWRLLGSQ